MMHTICYEMSKIKQTKNLMYDKKKTITTKILTIFSYDNLLTSANKTSQARRR